jgi:hypothetical protein
MAAGPQCVPIDIGFGRCRTDHPIENNNRAKDLYAKNLPLHRSLPSAIRGHNHRVSRWTGPIGSKAGAENF